MGKETIRDALRVPIVVAAVVGVVVTLLLPDSAFQFADVVAGVTGALTSVVRTSVRG